MAVDTLTRFREALRERVLVLDGGMGTVLLGYGLREEDFRGEDLLDHGQPLRGNLELLTLTRPDLIETIHRSYLNAGADILSTNTFLAQPLMQERYGTPDLVERINREAAELARRVVDDFAAYEPERRTFVAGVIGPTDAIPDTAQSDVLPDLRVVPAEEMANGYEVQALGLIRGGADLLLLETMSNTAAAVAACEGVQSACTQAGETVPLWISMTMDVSGERLLSGELFETFVGAVAPFAPVCLGLNCGYGARAAAAGIRRLGEMTDLPISCHPSAGIPDESGVYPEDPEAWAETTSRLVQGGLVNIVGGCCGTTPEHIRLLTRRGLGMTPRVWR